MTYVQARIKFVQLHPTDDTIRLGDFHSIDGGKTFNTVMNDETIGSRPGEFSKDRTFWRPGTAVVD